MSRRRKQLRPIQDPFVVAAPCGTRIRTRLPVFAAEAGVLTQVGAHLGGLLRADLVARLGVGDVPGQLNRRTDRKRGLTPLASSRWAGALTRAANDQYTLALRALRAEVAHLRAAVRTIEARAGVLVGQKVARRKGYHSAAER